MSAKELGYNILFNLVVFFIGGLGLMWFSAEVLNLFDRPGLGYLASGTLMFLGRWVVQFLIEPVKFEE